MTKTHLKNDKRTMKNKQSTPWQVGRMTAAGLALAALAGCSVTPQKLTRDEITTRVRTDQDQIYKEQEQLREPITFSVALARALKYNLDYRLKLMESTLSQGLLDVSKLDLLPKLVVDAGYQRRSNDSGGASIGIEDHVLNPRPTTSEERTHSMGHAELSWNALDFGISYFRAKQAADEYNIAEERRRKILQNIVQDVRNAYWRAVGAQRLLSEADNLLVRIRQALEQSRQAERSGAIAPGVALAYQRALLDAMSMVNAKRQEMDFAKRELAALMNVTPGTDFRMADVKEYQLAPVPLNVGELELTALQNRPELLEEDYRARVGHDEARKQLAALFPSLNVYAGMRYDSNNLLYNNNWADSGVNLSLNLFKLAGLPTIQRTNAARSAADDGRRMALSMAVITQVRVSIERYKLTMLEMELASESTRVDQRLASISRAGSSNKLESELEALRTESRAVVSRFQQATAYAGAQAAYGRIMNSVGLDLLPDTVTGTDIPTLARAIEAKMLDGERDVFLDTAVDVRRPQAFVLGDIRLAAGADTTAVRASLTRVLSRGALTLAPAGTAQAPVLSLNLEQSESPSGTLKALWHMQLLDGEGQRLMDETYVSYLPREFGERTLTAFAEAAVLSVDSKLREALLPRADGVTR